MLILDANELRTILHALRNSKCNFEYPDSLDNKLQRMIIEWEKSQYERN